MVLWLQIIALIMLSRWLDDKGTFFELKRDAGRVLKKARKRRK